MRPPAGPLLSAKLDPPSLPVQVRRDGLRELFEGAAAARLILVRAPAGFGKTTALAQYHALLRSRDVATAWLTLDSSDNDVSRFLQYLVAAVGQIAQDDPAPDAGGRIDSGPPASDAALQAIDRLTALDVPFALFLDEFETIQETAVLRLVRKIVEQLPRRGQLVIAARDLPDLQLGRLRAQGHLLEVDAEGLRFTLEETAEFLSLQRGAPLPPEQLFSLHRKTEGWPAALRLASIAIGRGAGSEAFIERFSGSDRALADYLADDVLARQPAAVRDFLLRTSVLRHLGAPVCDALVPGIDSDAMLRALESADIPLTRLERPERWYRYHSLFADFLRDRLARELPDEAPRMHDAASRWYEANGRFVAAIDHALEGGEHSRAAALLSRHAQDLLGQGRMRLLSRWFDALPEEQLRGRADLQLARAWAQAFTRSPTEAFALLDRIDPADATDPGIAAQLAVLRPVLLANMDEMEQARDVGQACLARLPSSSPFADGVLINTMASVLSVTGPQEEARRLLDRARAAQGREASAFGMMYSESVEGIIDLMEGRLRQATARFHLAVTGTRRLPGTHANSNAMASVLYASTLYEAGELDQAAHLLHIYVPLIRDIALPDQMILGHVLLSRLLFHRGDVDQALHLLTELEYLGHRKTLPRVVASARLERARMLMLQGNASAAGMELDRAGTPGLWERVDRMRLLAHDTDYLALARLRQAVAGSGAEAERALAGLEREIATALSANRLRRVLKLRLLRAMALLRSGSEAAALAAIGEVLAQAAPEGFIRLVVDEGPGAGLLVQRHAQSVAGRAQGASPLFGQYLDRLLQAFGPLPEEEPPAAQAPPADPLTRGEIRVLQLLAEGYSNNAMAEKLFVSENTVRSHLRNINAKLGARSRTQAVAIGRRLGLVR
ncbi:LuxR C-terminal-related transcriptional regulator [Quisquiliibacterium transsilvanicum]|nr:LuxR C-terminal-related transcriptional regulator [Quisquiliibacterium transsilvanicum]